MKTDSIKFGIEKKTSRPFRETWLMVSSGLVVGGLLQHVLQELKSCQELCGSEIIWLSNLAAGDNFTLFFGALAILLIALIVYLRDRLKERISNINWRSEVQATDQFCSPDYLLGPYLKSKYGFRNAATAAAAAATAETALSARSLKQPVVRADERAADVRALLNAKGRELSLKLARLRINRIRERLDQLANQIEQQTAIDNFIEFKAQVGELTGSLMYLTRSGQLFSSRPHKGVWLEC